MIYAVVGAAVRTSNRPLLRVAHLFATLLVALYVSTVGAGAATRSATLEAIHKMENPRNLSRPGTRGELGPYQFCASTWRMHTLVPFEQAVDRGVSEVVAMKHYEWLKRGLEAADVPATSYNIALAWNGGLSAAISGRSPLRAHEYAQRVTNLAGTIDAEPLKLFVSAH